MTPKPAGPKSGRPRLGLIFNFP